MLKSELLELGRRIAEARSGHRRFFLEQSARNPRLLGRNVTDRQDPDSCCTLNAAPIDIAPALRQMLFPRRADPAPRPARRSGVGRKGSERIFAMRVGADEAEPLQHSGVRSISISR